MKLTKFLILLAVVGVFAACRDTPESHQISPGGYTGENKSAHQNSSGHNSHGDGKSESHGAEAQHSETGDGDLSEVPRPQTIAEQMKSRGEQDSAAPSVKVVEPVNGATVNSSTVKVRLELSGDLKGYKPSKDANGMGNHIHVILDNQPYEAYYNLEQEFELRNVADGEHTLRFFPSRPWHESYKNDGAFQIIKFTVKNGGGDASKPATTNSNQVMSGAKSSSGTLVGPEGKAMEKSTAGAVDLTKPLLTYSRPKGEYKGADAEAIMIDFWLLNGKLVGDGGEYHIRYSVDGKKAKMIDKWQPIWLKGFADGKHSVKVELVDKNGNLVDNGGYNSTTREITVAK